ncbi:thioredoxin [Macrococcus hajekii]|uniref:Thioredoxin n=1 Tax=Macrococcus hajekii TaxID=198482 RepID=A0A4R6BK14_9STAP|nr:thioredoxin family protein [Macrococcus hajekii]TDM01956.1 thioredoxin [Macrococcus hajekii]GGB08825.1 thiol reductase thioredoxin [Macrococcus hajekii]
MKEINSYDELVTVLNDGHKKLVYTMITGCSVCHADYPRIESLVTEHYIEGYWLLVDKIPEVAGQLSLFTSPVVILFNKDREYHRQARIIDFSDLSLRIEQLKQEY